MKKNQKFLITIWLLALINCTYNQKINMTNLNKINKTQNPKQLLNTLYPTKYFIKNFGSDRFKKHKICDLKNKNLSHKNFIPKTIKILKFIFVFLFFENITNIGVAKEIKQRKFLSLNQTILNNYTNPNLNYSLVRNFSEIVSYNNSHNNITHIDSSVNQIFNFNLKDDDNIDSDKNSNSENQEVNRYKENTKNHFKAYTTSLPTLNPTHRPTHRPTYSPTYEKHWWSFGGMRGIWILLLVLVIILRCICLSLSANNSNLEEVGFVAP